MAKSWLELLPLSILFSSSASVPLSKLLFIFQDLDQILLILPGPQAEIITPSSVLKESLIIESLIYQ